MAGDWIKMRGNLWDDPRIAKLCDITGQGEAAIVGALYWLWASADQHTENGVMLGLSLRQIDRKTGINGFGDALIVIGWIADHPEGVRIVRFDEHNGTSAKRRCSESRRKMSARDADKMRTESGHAADVLQQSCAPRERVREEKEVNPPTSLREVSPPKPERKTGVTLSQWLIALKASGEKIVSDYKPLWAYCEKVGIPADWIEIAWLRFHDRYTTDEKASRKRYTDWRRVFLRAIEENWLGLWWYSEKDHQFRLSTVGIAADIATKEAA